MVVRGSEEGKERREDKVEGRWSTAHLPVILDNIVKVDTWHYALSKTHRLYNKKSEPTLKQNMGYS